MSFPFLFCYMPDASLELRECPSSAHAQNTWQSSNQQSTFRIGCVRNSVCVQRRVSNVMGTQTKYEKSKSCTKERKKESKKARKLVTKFVMVNLKIDLKKTFFFKINPNDSSPIFLIFKQTQYSWHFGWNDCVNTNYGGLKDMSSKGDRWLTMKPNAAMRGKVNTRNRWYQMPWLPTSYSTNCAINKTFQNDDWNLIFCPFLNKKISRVIIAYAIESSEKITAMRSVFSSTTPTFSKVISLLEQLMVNNFRKYSFGWIGTCLKCFRVIELNVIAIIVKYTILSFFFFLYYLPLNFFFDLLVTLSLHKKTFLSKVRIQWLRLKTQTYSITTESAKL